MSKPRAFCEFPAGLASVSLRLHGGKHCRPPISRMGNKAGYAAVILDALGLRSGEGAAAYLWAEADPDVRALIRAYPDAAMLTRIAEIIRGWADEEPRALWERLRAERKARPPMSDDLAGWVISSMWSYVQGNVRTGFVGPGERRQDTSAAACTSLAAYATIAASNRLINVAGPDLMNTGNGGTRFGGEFATPAVDVAGAFEEVAKWALLGQWSYRRGVPESGFNAGLLEDREPTDTGGNGAKARTCEQEAGLWSTAARASRWPPVAVLSAIPTAADVARWLGTPGDLSGVVVYGDPDYRDTTGYGNTCRNLIPGMAREFDALGAVVCISEQEPIPELPGWHATEITGGRKGQARTFSKQKAEWLTMNRPPAHTVAVQRRLFG